MPIAPTPGPTMTVHSEGRTPSVGWAIASAASAVGRREPTASAAGEACAPVVSAAAGLVAAASAAVVLAASTVGAGVRRPVREGYLCRTYLRIPRF